MKLSDGSNTCDRKYMWYIARFGTLRTILKNKKNTYGGVLLLVKLQAELY